MTGAATQTTTFIIVMLAFLISHMWWRPYESRSFFVAELASMACLLVTAALATLVQGSPGVPALLQDATPFFMIMLNTATVLALAGLYARLLARAHCATARLYGGRLARGCQRSGCHSFLHRAPLKPLRSAVPTAAPLQYSEDGSSGRAADASAHLAAAPAADARPCVDSDEPIRRFMSSGISLAAAVAPSATLADYNADAGLHSRAASAAAYLAANKSNRAAAAASAVRPARLQLAATRAFETS